MMYFHTAKVHYLLYYSRIKTKPRQNELFMTWGRLFHLGVRALHTQRPPPQPATLCRPQRAPTHQRARQPALPRSRTDTARNLVSQIHLRAIASPRSQTAPAAPAADAVQWSHTQSHAVVIRSVTGLATSASLSCTWLRCDRICSSCREGELDSSGRWCEYSRVMSSFYSMRLSIGENLSRPAEIWSMVGTP